MLHTNLEFRGKSKSKIDKKTAHKVVGIVVAFVSILFLGSRLFAASSISWNFDSASDYTVSDSNKIEVTNGEAKLKQVEASLTDDIQSEFNAGTHINTEYVAGKLTVGNAQTTVTPAITTTLLSRGKPVTMSTVHPSFSPSLCTDGATGNQNFCHTNTYNANEWLQIDLQANVDIGRIVLWNRLDCCQDRIKDFKVEVSNTGSFSGEQTLVLTQTNQNVGRPSIYDFAQVNGRYVRFTLLNANAISLAEVELYGFSNPNMTSYNANKVPGLVSQWRFDGNANDSVGLNNGTLQGTTTFVETSKFGTHSAYFDGNDHISMANVHDIPTGNAPYTIAGWIKPYSMNTGGIIGWGSYGSTSQATALRLNGNALLHYWWSNDLSANTPSLTDDWHYVVATHTGSVRTIFLDGKQIGYQVINGHNNTNMSNLTLGKSANAEYFHGLIDQLEVYNIALTDEQIRLNYLKGQGQFGTFISAVSDTTALDGATWMNIGWNTKYPYGKPLPNNLGVESGYTSGNLDMTGNLFLWHFNGNWNDSSGNNRNGTPQGNVTLGNTSPIGDSAAIFDGGGDYIRVSNITLANNSFTVSVWAQRFATGRADYIFGQGSLSNNNGLHVGFRNTNVFSCDFYYNTLDTTPYTDNDWHHWACTYDATSNVRKIFRDGLEVASNTASVDYGGSGDFLVGLLPWGGGDFYGNLDEVAVFNRPLNSTEIQNMYQRGTSRIKFQVKSCNDDQCNGESFLGPDGTANTYFTELNNSTNTIPRFDFLNVSNNRYFQYKTIIEALNPSQKPELTAVTSTFESYALDKPNLRLTTEEDLGIIPASINQFCEGTIDVNNTCTTTSTKPANTEIYHQICNDTVSNCNANNSWKYWDGDSWENANSTQYNTANDIDANISSFIPSTKYFAFKSFLSSGGQSTPILTDLSISAVLDTTAPTTNATSIQINGKNSGDWTNVKPTFEWVAGEDNQDGVGILGYCIALDESNLDLSQNLNPATSAGVLQNLDDGVSQNYCPFIATGTSINLANITGLNLVTNKEYNFSIKAVDSSGNIWSGGSGDYQDLFTFKYDGTAPINPAFISMPSNFISSKDVTITWPTGSDGASDVGVGLAGLQYKIGQNGTWYGDLHNGNQNLTDLLVNDGAYTMDADFDYPNLIDGSNVIYFRAMDLAGNISTSNVTGVLKINTTAPNQVQNLQVTPSDNSVNAYSFNWEDPDTYIGNANGLTYCYTINTLPNANNCTYTAAGITSIPSDAYATQPGSNNFYVVAKDEAGNINYATYSAVEFTYSGEAPGIPLNVDVSDLSVKETQDWKLAVTWATPANIGAGVSSYKIFRSTDENAACNVNMGGFTQVSSVLGTSFIDTDLDQQDYYYCVKACDSANNCSAASTTKSNFPTGKYTTPANLISEPLVNATTTRKAVISWTTDRRSDSRIQYGLSSNSYFDEEVGNSTQLTAHTVTLNGLTAGTTYYYRAKWTDEDGNIGTSEEKAFTTNPPPTIISAKTSRVGIDSAIIQFTSVDTYRVNIYYGTTVSFGGLKQLDTATIESSYTSILEGLQDNALYYFKINSVDTEGFEYEGTVLDFKTLPRPTVSNIQIEEVKNVAQPTVKVNWTSNTEVSSIVTYYPEGREEEARDAVELDLLTTHEMTLVGLRAETRYVLFVKGIDSLGNEAVSSPQMFTTATDTRPPKISNVKVEAINPDSSETTSQIIVSWETDELATSQVEYGEGTTGSYSQSTQIDKNLSYKHVVIITNLKPASVYHLKALSEDNSKNTSETSNIVTITPKQQDTAFDIVLKGLGDIFSFL